MIRKNYKFGTWILYVLCVLCALPFAGMTDEAQSKEEMQEVLDGFFSTLFAGLDPEEGSVLLGTYLSSDFKLVSDIINLETGECSDWHDGRSSFLEDMRVMHFGNAVEFRNTSIDYSEGNRMNTLCAHYEGEQYRLGHGLIENGESWYHLSADLEFGFVRDKEGTLLVQYFFQENYTKQRLPEEA